MILLSTDATRDLYDSRAPALFKKYGGGDWPSIILPDGMNSAILFGGLGYGRVIVDEEGIVRSIGEYDLLESMKTVFPDTEVDGE